MQVFLETLHALILEKKKKEQIMETVAQLSTVRVVNNA